MKTLIIYKSYHHGNTEKVAKAMAEAAGARLLRLEDAKPGNLEGFDLIGFGSGIYFGKHHKDLRAFVEKLPQQANRQAFVFSTCGSGKTQHRTFRELLEKKGFTIKGHFTCKGFDTFGPFLLIGGLAKGHPDVADLAAAKDFAARTVK